MQTDVRRRSSRGKLSREALLKLGRVLIDYSAIGPSSIGYMLTLADATASTTPGTWIIEAAPAGSLLVFQAAPVVPGEYVATMKIPSFHENGTSLVVPERLTVRAGETTRIVFRKP